ncbi:hypothetical protein CCP3SC15_1920008 [Gammaproteobacteria bacterium]
MSKISTDYGANWRDAKLCPVAWEIINRTGKETGRGIMTVQSKELDDHRETCKECGGNDD